jgi:flavin reductase (DIM6/NTAB) family NADH-FMN oxidoreductase RutF
MLKVNQIIEPWHGLAWLITSRPIGIALGKIHFTNPGIKENGSLSINIPSGNMAEVTDYCGIVSEKKYDKGQEFKTFYGTLYG